MFERLEVNVTRIRERRVGEERERNLDSKGSSKKALWERGAKVVAVARGVKEGAGVR